jgi:Leucine-rich repeat (LRR) protein
LLLDHIKNHKILQRRKKINDLEIISSNMRHIQLFGTTVIIILFFANCSGYEKLNKALANPEKVTKLKIKYGRIGSLPKEIEQLTNLKTLYLFKNKLTTIPEEIGNLKNLETLVISSNNLVELPASICQLTKLKKLSLKHNYIKQLPNEMGNLVNLEELYLEYNGLISLPYSIGNLSNLEMLNISNNNLFKIPNEIGKLYNLRFFVIGKNNLVDLPDEIGNLSSLRELNVAFCGPMVKIPETIRYCKNLEFLYIDKTSILPYSINNVNSRLQVVIKEKGELN